MRDQGPDNFLHESCFLGCLRKLRIMNQVGWGEVGGALSVDVSVSCTVGRDAFYVLSASGRLLFRSQCDLRPRTKELRFFCFSALLSYEVFLLASPAHRIGEELNLLDMGLALG